ncbi:putative uncharacterized protein DDB_G0282133 [Argopecten irradians]|uniref:putative uncharacterized protein DDB_G0282133 n=1 Tax=Argopecten irradians TaxID=31199 RepID=UPI0037150C64
MDAKTLKTLSNIINLELNKLTPQEQGQLQGPSQVNSQNQVHGPANNVQYPQLSSEIANGMSNSQQQASSVMGSSQIKQEGQGYYQNNNLSNQPALDNGQVGGPVSQPQFNPGQMMISSMGGGDSGIQGVPNSMFPAAGGGRPSAGGNVEVDSPFDPNRLMASIEAETSQYNPNAFLAKQNYITANQWNFANQNQISQNTHFVNQGTNTAKGQHNNPAIMDTSQLNFNPDIMMTALGIKGQKFTFNPDKINSFSSSGFQPGLYPQSAGGQKIPKNMFNADTVNKMLMAYVVVPTEKTKHQPRKHHQISQDIHKTVYNPDTFNHAAVNEVPSTYLQFISNEGRVTVVPSNTKIRNGNPMKQSVVTPSQMRLLKQQTGDHFRAQLEPPISVMDRTPSFENAFKSVTFNPDRINAAQRQFNPDLLYRSLLLGEDRKVLPRKHMPKLARKAVRAENGTDIVVTNKTGEIRTTTTTDPNDSGQSTTVPSAVTSTQQPNTTVISTTSTTTTTTDGVLFNPNNINTGIAQMMGFNPGSLMMGYNLPQQGQNTDNGNYAYNPNQMGGFQSVMSPMMSVLMGESGGDSNTVSQTASRPNYDQSQGMSVMFNPADVNQAKMSFDINKQMGFNENSGNAMFDPMQVNVLANQNVNKSTNNSFLGSNGMGMMGNNIFTGVFDPNKINQVSMTDMQVSKQKNSSASSPVTNYMAAFLGMGGFGGNDQSSFGGSFNPSEVNNAVFNPNDVNNAQMNFDPSNMLDHNPGYDSEKATQTDFDPTKINDVHMNFQPPFVSTDKNKDNNSSSSNAFSRYNLNFTPGQLSPNGNAMVFNPNEINQATMHFSVLEVFNSTVPQGNTNFLSQLSGKDSNVVMPDFDPVAVNNMQVNFVPNSPLGAYQSSLTTTGPKPQPSSASVPTSTSPPTTTSQTTSTAAPGTISTPVPTR